MKSWKEACCVFAAGLAFGLAQKAILGDLFWKGMSSGLISVALAGVLLGGLLVLLADNRKMMVAKIIRYGLPVILLLAGGVALAGLILL